MHVPVVQIALSKMVEQKRCLLAEIQLRRYDVETGETPRSIAAEWEWRETWGIEGYSTKVQKYKNTKSKRGGNISTLAGESCPGPESFLSTNCHVTEAFTKVQYRQKNTR